jgi:hypothetical protein
MGYVGQISCGGSECCEVYEYRVSLIPRAMRMAHDQGWRSQGGVPLCPAHAAESGADDPVPDPKCDQCAGFPGLSRFVGHGWRQHRLMRLLAAAGVHTGEDLVAAMQDGAFAYRLPGATPQQIDLIQRAHDLALETS